jgi:MOSC domain-containing protein YiiM
MMTGNIQSIHIAEKSGDSLRPVETVSAIAGHGLSGDRYAGGRGTYSGWPGDHELTLIEAEVAKSVDFAPGESRRNITTRGIRLNDLVGKRFRIGGALCEGTRLCEPCAHLERITERPGLVKELVGRGGLRAVILESGEIRVGDTIAPVETSEISEREAVTR